MPKDCVQRKDGTWINRFKLNCENFQFPPGCTKKILRDLSKPKPSLEDILVQNRCNAMSEWIYKHGDETDFPKTCEVIRGLCTKVEGINLYYGSCQLLRNGESVSGEVQKLAKELEKMCFQGTVTITGTPHLQATITDDCIIDYTNPPGNDFNIPYTLVITAKGCGAGYRDCKIGQRCLPAQRGEVAICLDPQTKRPKTQTCTALTAKTEDGKIVETNIFMWK